MKDGLDRAALWLAQGFGIGRIPFAPGTWGSLLGLPLLALLLSLGSVWLALTAMLASFGCSVYGCGRAEIRLGETDPGSVVLDEIVAIPLCFAGWIGVETWRAGQLPGPPWLLLPSHWLGIAAIFLAFRLFDIWKPWPVRQSQRLPGGWGVTVDDLLAAVYVNLVSLPFLYRPL